MYRRMNPKQLEELIKQLQKYKAAGDDIKILENDKKVAFYGQIEKTDPPPLLDRP